MPGWLAKALRRIHALAAALRIRLTYKANREAVGLGLDLEDVRQLLMGLTVGESAGRQASAATGEWLYIFKPGVGGVRLYLKLILRDDCVVVSCHDDDDAHDTQ
ncbi:MAG: type II toxin-antitoxin system MqsR family toxin [Longimicrobiales bacterium]